MGIETALIAAAAVGAATSIAGGIQQRNAAKKQANLMQADADARAREEEKSGQRYRNKQVVAYLKSGVTLEGSPLLAMQETIDTSRKNAATIRSNAAVRADTVRQEGRNAFIGGLFSAARTTAGGYANYRTLQTQGYI